MFLYEKFLKKNGCNKIHQKTSSKGYFVYQYKNEDEKLKIEIVSFFWTKSKEGGPDFFNFRKSIVYSLENGEYIIEHSNNKVYWNEFFHVVNFIKNDIKKHKNLFVCSDSKEAKLLMWKSFVMTQDLVFSRYLHSFPITFYNTLDESISVEDRCHNLSDFLSCFLRNSLPFVYSNWVSFFETNMEQHFCEWFKDFLEQDG